jgi:hypothetical protein
MAVAALVISLLALLFTLSSFWWLNARRGAIQAATPQGYAFVDGFRLRLPLALFNSGAVPLLITDLRIQICGVGYSHGRPRDRRYGQAPMMATHSEPRFRSRDATPKSSLRSSVKTTTGSQNLVPTTESA